ncbi:response regulator [Cupriavidus basilensis]
MVVELYASGNDLLQSHNLDAVSCLVTDVQMPAMNGFALCEALRKRGLPIPVIFMTAFPEESYRQPRRGARRHLFSEQAIHGPRDHPMRRDCPRAQCGQDAVPKALTMSDSTLTLTHSVRHERLALGLRRLLCRRFHSRRRHAAAGAVARLRHIRRHDRSSGNRLCMLAYGCLPTDLWAAGRAPRQAAM